MKLNKTIIVSLMVTSLLISCSTTPEDACGCIQQAANDYMLQGVKVSRMNDLRAPCQSQIDAVKNDAKARAKITACVTEVMENIENKTLCKVDTASPEFPAHSFKTMQDFVEAVNKEGGEYKYWRTTITIDEVYISSLSALNDSIFEKDKEGKEFYLIGGFAKQGNDWSGNTALKISKKLVNPKLFQEPFKLYDKLIWDTKEHKYLDGLFSKDTEAAKYIGDLLKEDYLVSVSGSEEGLVQEYESQFLPNPYEYMEEVPKEAWIGNRVQYTRQQKGFETFIEDMKKGRYKYITQEDFNKIAGNGSSHLCLTKAKIQGVVFKSQAGVGIEVSVIENIKKMPYPSLLSSPGKTYDFSQYANFVNEY